MMKKTLIFLFLVVLILGFSGCQTVNFDLKRGWDSVPVSQTPLVEVIQRAPLPDDRQYLPTDDYWYKYQGGGYYSNKNKK